MQDTFDFPLRNESELISFEREFKLPQFNTTLPVLRNKMDKLSLNTHVIELVKLVSGLPEERFEKIRGATLWHSYIVPHCRKWYKYERVLQINLMMGVIDDICDQTDQSGNRYIEFCNKIWQQFQIGLEWIEGKDTIIDSNELEPCVVFVLNIIQELYDFYDSGAKLRLIGAWKQYFQAQINENTMTKNGFEYGSVEEMCKFRFKSAGLMLCVMYIEYANDINLTDEEYYDIRVQKLIESVGYGFVCINDVYSFEKEYNNFERQIWKMSNTVAFKVLKENITIEEAMFGIIEMAKHYEQVARDMTDQIISDPNCSPAKELFTKNLGNFISGNYVSSAKMDRYNKYFKKQEYK